MSVLPLLVTNGTSEEFGLAFGEPGPRGDQMKRDKQTEGQKNEVFRHRGGGQVCTYPFPHSCFLQKVELGNLFLESREQKECFVPKRFPEATSSSARRLLPLRFSASASRSVSPLDLTLR